MRTKIVSVLLALLLVDAVTLAYAVFHGPYPSCPPLGAPTAYRNMYIHIPVAWATYALFTGAFVSAIAYLYTRKDSLDDYVKWFAGIGVAYAAVTLVTGSAWASESWGSPWNWDPRETSVLLLFLAYLVYFAVRASIADPDRAKVVSAVYAVAAYAMIPVSFLAPLLVPSLHPTMAQFKGVFVNPVARGLFFFRAILVVVEALLLVYIAVKDVKERLLSYAGLVFAVYGLTIAMVSAAPLLSGGAFRVLGVELAGDNTVALLVTNKGNFTFNPPVKAPIELIVKGCGRPTLLYHYVVVQDGSITIVNHWSVAFDTASYTVLLGVLLFVLTRGRVKRQH